MGMRTKQLHRRWLRSIHDLEAAVLTSRAKDINDTAGASRDDKMRAVAYLAKKDDKGALSTFTYWGLFAMVYITNAEYEVVAQRYFGVPIRALLHLVGPLEQVLHVVLQVLLLVLFPQRITALLLLLIDRLLEVIYLLENEYYEQHPHPLQLLI